MWELGCIKCESKEEYAMQLVIDRKKGMPFGYKEKDGWICGKCFQEQTKWPGMENGIAPARKYNDTGKEKKDYSFSTHFLPKVKEEEDLNKSEIIIEQRCRSCGKKNEDNYNEEKICSNCGGEMYDLR